MTWLELQSWTQTSGREIFISQLADDTVLFLKDVSQVSVAISTLESFSRASGLFLNRNKCELLPVNKCTVSYVSGIPVKSCVIYLGIVITKDMNSSNALNLNPIINKTQNVLNNWLQRDLSLKGRTLLTKAEGLSRLTYAAQSLHVNNSTCKSVDKILFIYIFIFCGKIKFTTFSNP